MKRWLIGSLMVLALLASARTLHRRWVEERADNRVAIVVDWQEFTALAAREGASVPRLMARLREAGVQGIALAESPLADYTDRVFLKSERKVAEDLLLRLQRRGVASSLQTSGGGIRLLTPPSVLDAKNELNVGFELDVIRAARQEHLSVILRVNDDPWMSKDDLFQHLNDIRQLHPSVGYVLGSDETPGGAKALSDWASWLTDHQDLNLLFEFKPAKAAKKLARRAPAFTFRAHTIPSNELKDMAPDRAMARWRRAVDERSCRVLLVHASPADSSAHFLENVRSLGDALTRDGREMGMPVPRQGWSTPGRWSKHLAPSFALLAAILMPIIALRGRRSNHFWVSYLQMAFLLLAGGCVVAALADNPWLRIEVSPFRGVKLAFILAWAGSLLSLYSWKDITEILSEHVRRRDLVLAALVLGVLGYIVVRMGNASAGWKIGWEQNVREGLERLLVARPRFKEFAVGYPLLLLGLYMESLSRGGRGPGVLGVRDGRWLIAIGMIGPISTINTFCHIHSPLYLAFWRSANGMGIGFLIGLLLIPLFRWMDQRL